MSQSDSLLVKIRKYCFIIKQSDSLLIKLRKHYFLSVVAGAVGGLIYTVLDTQNPQNIIIGAIVGGFGYSNAEVISLLSKTLWQRLLLWVATAIVIINLIHFLVPSLGFSFLFHSIPFVPSSLLNYVIRRRLSTHKKH